MSKRKELVTAVTYCRDGISCVLVTLSSRAWNMWNAFRREADSPSMPLILHANPTRVSNCDMLLKFY